MQNGVAVYATWGTLFTLLNLTIYLQHLAEVSKCDCAKLSLLLLLMKLLGWWVRLPAAFCRLAAGVFFYPPRAMLHEQRNSNLPSLSSFAPRFLLENFHLDKHVRYIVTVYPVVMLWMSGILSNSSSHGTSVYIFSGSLTLHFLLPIRFFFKNTLLILILLIPSSACIMAITTCLFVARIALVTWRHRKQPLYNDTGPSMSPVEIALTQGKLCLWTWARSLTHHFCVVVCMFVCFPSGNLSL